MRQETPVAPEGLLCPHCHVDLSANGIYPAGNPGKHGCRVLHCEKCHNLVGIRVGKGKGERIASSAVGFAEREEHENVFTFVTQNPVQGWGSSIHAVGFAERGERWVSLESLPNGMLKHALQPFCFESFYTDKPVASLEHRLVVEYLGRQGLVGRSICPSGGAVWGIKAVHFRGRVSGRLGGQASCAMWLQLDLVSEGGQKQTMDWVSPPCELGMRLHHHGGRYSNVLAQIDYLLGKIRMVLVEEPEGGVPSSSE